MHSRAVEDYLKAIFKLERGSAPATTNALAESLDRSAASVTNMVKSLAEQDLVVHEPYRGVRLTAAGRTEALRIIRRHRVIETYLIERLGYTWDGVHVEAERLEHAASDDLVDRMARALGDPAFDPHGAPIPASDGTLVRRDLTPLADLPDGCSAVVGQVADHDAEQLRMLGARGFLLGAHVEIVESLRDGGRVVRIGPETVELGPQLVAAVQVETNIVPDGTD